MAATVNTERVIETTVGGGPRPGNGFRKNGGGRFGRDGEPLQFSPSRYRIGAWAGIGGIVMLFTALASAYIVRSASGNDWQPIVMPKVLWLSTAVILLSSVTMEKRRLPTARMSSTQPSHFWIASITLTKPTAVRQTPTIAAETLSLRRLLPSRRR